MFVPMPETYPLRRPGIAAAAGRPQRADYGTLPAFRPASQGRAGRRSGAGKIGARQSLGGYSASGMSRSARFTRLGTTTRVRAVAAGGKGLVLSRGRSEGHTSELQSLMRISYAVFCLKKNKNKHHR